MDWLFLLYVVLSIVFLLGATYKTITDGSPITAAIIFVGILSAIIYFGIQWFTTYGNVINEGGAWPPDGSINVCPDFFSLGKTNGVYVCKDPLGVTKISGDFDLKLSNIPPTSTRQVELCNECNANGVTWEGVFDGTSCVGKDRMIPLPPK